MKAAAARRGEAANVDSSFPRGSSEPSEALTAAAVVDGDAKIQPIVLQPPFQPHADDTYHVNDLLKYHDQNFIQNAYRAILKRGPDATGYKGFIEGLRSGRLNKIDILARLRYSSEGRAKKVRTEGLLLPAIIRMGYRIPVLGYLLNLAVGIMRLPPMVQNQQQFEAHILAQMETVAATINSTAQGLHMQEQQTITLMREQGTSRDLVAQASGGTQGRI